MNGKIVPSKNLSSVVGELGKGKIVNTVDTDAKLYIMVVFPYYYGDITMKGNETEVIRMLIEKQGEDISIHSLSKALKKDYKTTYGIVKRLEALALVQLKPIGKSLIIALKIRAHPLIIEAEYERRRALGEKFEVLLQDLEGIPACFIALLFGSYAKGIQTRHSDIDLLIISEDDTLMNRALKISPLPLHITSITPSEFISMLKSKEFTVGSEVVKKNIVLVGVEDYYRLRAHAA